jgi:hypothetical protein
LRTSAYLLCGDWDLAEDLTQSAPGPPVPQLGAQPVTLDTFLKITRNSTFAQYLMD